MWKDGEHDRERYKTGMNEGLRERRDGNIFAAMWKIK
jgi:hypothetical protein